MSRTNYFKYPTFFNSSTSEVIDTNLARNPSFEGLAGSWELARNYHPNPGAVASTTGFNFYSGGDGNTASMSLVNAEWSLSGSAARATWASVVNSKGDINAVVGPIAGVGTVVTVVFRWVASRSGMVMGAPGAYDENVGYITTTARSRSANLTAIAGEVVEDWETFAIPQWATADLQLFVDVIGKQAGDFVEMSMADAYLGEYQPHRKWFSGNFSTDSDLTPSWTGSTNASASVLRATGVSGVTAGGPNGWKIASSQWASSGDTSVRNYRPEPGTIDSYIGFPGSWFPDFAPGRVYGVKAKIRLEKPLSGSIVGPNQQPSRLRRFMAVFRGIVGEFGSSDQYPNEPGVHEIQWVFTVPEGATALDAFRVYSGHSDGDHWVDDVVIIAGDNEDKIKARLVRDYVSDPDFEQEFTGTVNNSTVNVIANIIDGIESDGAYAVQSKHHAPEGGYSMRLCLKNDYVPSDGMTFLPLPQEVYDKGSFHVNIFEEHGSFRIYPPASDHVRGPGRKSFSWDTPRTGPSPYIYFHLTSDDSVADDVWFSEPMLSSDPNDSGDFFHGNTPRKESGEYVVLYSWMGAPNESYSIESDWTRRPYAGVEWGHSEDRIFSIGIDRGVLYIDGVGVPWNGLISAEVRPSGGEPEAYYIDGVKRYIYSQDEEFKGEIQAFTAPLEFLKCDGSFALSDGFYAHQQYRHPFSLSWRSIIGNARMGQKFAYKLHFVYGAIAAPTASKYETLSDSTDPDSLAWSITTNPVQANGLYGSYFTLYSNLIDPEKLQELEQIMYGSEEVPARLPLPDEIVSILDS